MSRTAKQKFARRVIWELIISVVINVALGCFIAYYTDMEDFWKVMTGIFVGTFLSFVICDFLIVYTPARMDEKYDDGEGNWQITFEWRNPLFVLKFILWNIFLLFIGWVTIIIADESFTSKLPAILYFGVLIALVVQFIIDNSKSKK